MLRSIERDILSLKNCASTPMFLDSRSPCGMPQDDLSLFSSGFCIDRHSGYVNGLFLDWSARKVGLKELWTLKWYQEFDTANKWTKAGGAQPEDWPEWMRAMKDY
jgi:prepilin-type processing-associated H-X9-DG protein